MHKLSDPRAPPAPTIGFDHFLAVDIRIGTIVSAERFPEARVPALKLTLDFGDGIGRRRSSAQVTQLYTPETLVGRRAIAVVNLAPRQVGTFMSEVLVLGFADEAGRVVLLALDGAIPDGARLF